MVSIPRENHGNSPDPGSVLNASSRAKNTAIANEVPASRIHMKMGVAGLVQIDLGVMNLIAQLLYLCVELGAAYDPDGF